MVDHSTFMALGDACDICMAINGKSFKVKDMMPGENAPPMHPHCRCTTVSDDSKGREELDALLDFVSKGGTEADWNKFGKAAWKESGEMAKRVPKEIADMIEDYFKKTANASKGLGAKIGGEGLIPLHEEPVLLKKINHSNINDIQNELKNFERNAITESVETACVVTTNGEVYKCFGVNDRVFPDYDLGDKLKGATVTHNHPIDETVFSFSKDDLQLFMQYDINVLRGCDEKYTYEFNRNPADIDDMPVDWMTFENYNHADIIRLAKEYGVGYRRWKNE